MDCEVEFMREALPTATENGADLALSNIGCVIIMDGVIAAERNQVAKRYDAVVPPLCCRSCRDRCSIAPAIKMVWRHCETTGNRGRTVTRKVNFAYFEIMSRR